MLIITSPSGCKKFHCLPVLGVLQKRFWGREGGVLLGILFTSQVDIAILICSLNHDRLTSATSRRPVKWLKYNQVCWTSQADQSRFCGQMMEERVNRFHWISLFIMILKSTFLIPTPPAPDCKTQLKGEEREAERDEKQMLKTVNSCSFCILSCKFWAEILLRLIHLYKYYSLSENGVASVYFVVAASTQAVLHVACCGCLMRSVRMLIIW